MTKSIKHMLINCAECGCPFLPNIDGGEKVCDTCIEEDEAIRRSIYRSADAEVYDDGGE